MRKIYVIVLILALTVSALSLEDTLTFDRCQIVNHPTDGSLPTKLVIHFRLPDAMMEREIILAEVTTLVAMSNVSGDSLLELDFHPFLAQPPDEDIDYDALGPMTDSLGAGAWTCRFDSAASFRVDITEFVRAVALSERENYGLAGTLDLLGEANVVIPPNLAEQIMGAARVRVVYR